MSRNSLPEGVLRWARNPGAGSSWLILLILILLFHPSSRVSAQSPGDTLVQRVETELERLIPLRRELGVRSRQADSIHDARIQKSALVKLDTFQVGPFRVAAQGDQRKLATGLFSRLWSDIAPSFQGAEGLFGPWTFVVQYGRDRARIGPALLGDSAIRVVTGGRIPRSVLEGMAYVAGGKAVSRTLPEETNGWLGGRVLAPSESMSWIARELVVTPSRSVRGCYRGDLEECKAALDLRGEEGTWATWYTPEERRAVVARMGRPGSDPQMAALWDGCTELAQHRACDVFLSDKPAIPPLTTYTRTSVLRVALRMGGEGAAWRLMDSIPGPVQERLARVASAPIDSVVATWRREILGAMPSAWAGMGRTPATALFWLLLFGLLALRSTRWRLG